MLSRSVPRQWCAVTAASLLVSMLAVGSMGSGTAAAQSAGTVLICEATGNPSAPYVEIRVNQSDLGNYSAGEGDIIPAPAGGCPTSGAAVPTETSATATTTSSATSTVTSSVSTASAVAPHKHKTTTVASSTQTPSAVVVATSASQTASFTADLTPEPPATLQTLPRTGGQVPLTLALGLLALLGGGLLRWSLVRRRRPHTDARALRKAGETAADRASARPGRALRKPGGRGRAAITKGGASARAQPLGERRRGRARRSRAPPGWPVRACSRRRAPRCSAAASPRPPSTPRTSPRRQRRRAPPARRAWPVRHPGR